MTREKYLNHSNKNNIYASVSLHNENVYAVSAFASVKQ